MQKRIAIESRSKQVINTDPQRRCYWGANYSEAVVWTPWKELVYDVPPDKVEDRLQWWKELNDYAVSQRGKLARSEFRAVTKEVTNNVLLLQG